VTDTLIIGLIVLSGCSDSPAIQPASSSKSKFQDSVYHGESVTVNPTPPGIEEFRVFQEGATGFVSIQSVRETAEQRAADFCERSGKVMKSLRETTAKPPYIFGNFPRVEIIFGCVDKRPARSPADNDSKYKKLVELKKLLDTGVLTQQEFEQEKAKVLNQP
jgi:hypothetical protein